MSWIGDMISGTSKSAIANQKNMANMHHQAAQMQTQAANQVQAALYEVAK